MLHPNIVQDLRHHFANIESPRIKNLLMAVLERAILDALSPPTDLISQEAKQRARFWIADIDTDSDNKEPFSFDWICEALDINPYSLRIALTNGTLVSTPLKKWTGRGRLGFLTSMYELTEIEELQVLRL
jgi:hypothetical protein